MGLGLVVRVGPMDLVGPRLAGQRLVDRRLVGLRMVHRPLVGPRPVDRRPVDRRPVVRVGLVDLMVPAARVGLHRVDLAGLVVLNMAAPGGLDRMHPVAPVGLDRMDREVPNMVVRVGLHRTGLVVPNMAAPVGLDRMDQVVLAVPVVLGVLVDPVVLNMAGRVGPVAPADHHHRRRTCSTVSTTVVARSGVDRETRRTASARPITARRPRHRNTDSGGTVDLPRERRHPTGTGHRLLAAGTGRRPPVAGIPIGTGPDAT